MHWGLLFVVGECFLQVVCVWDWCFQSLWIVKGAEKRLDICGRVDLLGIF